MNMRWVIVVALIWGGIILFDEFAYQWWRTHNPGSRWTNLRNMTSPLSDPRNPPTSGVQ